MSTLHSRATRGAALGALALFVFGTIAHADPADAGAGGSASLPVPPAITVLQSSPRVAPGLIFVAPKNGGAPPPTGGLAPPPPGSTFSGPVGPEIVDNQGRPVWFYPVPAGQQATDFRVQTYRGERVLTWTQSGTDHIADRSYHLIASVTSGGDLASDGADGHEFRLTPEGTALITVYKTVHGDLSSVGGPSSGLITEGAVEEIDIATGAVLFEWHSLDHVPLSESHVAPPTSSTAAYDYFHINAVNPDVDGNLIISSRHTWTVYKLDRHTGAIIWRLGGKSSDFELGPGVAFAWQHNPLVADGPPGTIRIFDNESNGPSPVLPYSRVIWVRHDDVQKTATLEREFVHPQKLQAPSQGNSQALDNGDTFVGWGALGRFSEFDPDGNLLFDATVPVSEGYDDYRAYRFEWTGAPDTDPTVTVEGGDASTPTVHAIWNGATEVARWVVLGGSSASARGLSFVAEADWNGLDTSISVPTLPTYVQVVARDRYGREIGRSAVTASAP
jgi:hypothetical protein